MQKREGHQEQALSMAGQAFQQLRQTVHITVHFSRQDVDVITGADSLLLFVDFAAVDIGQFPLHQLNGFYMVKGLDMHGDHLRGLHTQEIHQHTVIQLRCQDVHEAHGSHLLADHEPVAILEVQTARRNEILGGQAGGREPLPIEQERRLGFIHVHHAVHELQAFLAIQRFSLYSQPFQMIQQLQFDLLQPGLCCTDAFSLDGERDVLAALQGIVAFRHLTQQHRRKLVADMIEAIVLMRDDQGLLKLSLVDLRVHEAELHMHIRLKEVQDTAPAAEDRLTILLLGLLVVDVVKTDGFGVAVFRHPAQAVRIHPQVRNGLLSGLGMLGLFRLRHDLRQLLLFSPGQFHLGDALTFFVSGQCVLPPFQVLPAGQGQHGRYRYSRVASSDEGSGCECSSAAPFPGADRFARTVRKGKRASSCRS